MLSLILTLTLLSIITIIVVNLTLYSEKFNDDINIYNRIDNNKINDTFLLEIADTPGKRQLGLMYRNSLSQNRGMLFVFPEAGKYKMWMKNTKIPLDLIYLDDEGFILGIVRNMVPNSLKSYGLDIHSRYLVELNAGVFDKLNLGVGDKLNYEIQSKTN